MTDGQIGLAQARSARWVARSLGWLVPIFNTETLGLHQPEISLVVAPGAYAVMLITPDVIPPAFPRELATSGSSRCLSNSPRSTRSRTHGSSCAANVSRTGLSYSKTASVIRADRPGTKPVERHRRKPSSHPHAGNMLSPCSGLREAHAQSVTPQAAIIAPRDIGSGPRLSRQLQPRFRRWRSSARYQDEADRRSTVGAASGRRFGPARSPTRSFFGVMPCRAKQCIEPTATDTPRSPGRACA